MSRVSHLGNRSWNYKCTNIIQRSGHNCGIISHIGAGTARDQTRFDKDCSYFRTMKQEQPCEQNRKHRTGSLAGDDSMHARTSSQECAETGLCPASAVIHGQTTVSVYSSWNVKCTSISQRRGNNCGKSSHDVNGIAVYQARLDQNYTHLRIIDFRGASIKQELGDQMHNICSFFLSRLQWDFLYF